MEIQRMWSVYNCGMGKNSQGELFGEGVNGDTLEDE